MPGGSLSRGRVARVRRRTALLLLLESAQSPHPRTQITPTEDLLLLAERCLTIDLWCVNGVTEFPRILLWAAPVCVRVRRRERRE